MRPAATAAHGRGAGPLRFPAKVQPAGGPLAAGPASVHGAAAAPGTAALLALAIPLDRIAPDPGQPRRSFDEAGLQALAASIRACGVVQPLLVAPHPDRAAWAATPYQLVHGERRWIAARRAGVAAVPAVVHERPLAAPDRLMMQIAESDGVLREDLRLCDLAVAVARAFALARCTQVQFAHRYRRSQTWVCNLLYLARVAGEQGPAREALEEGRLRGILAARTFLRLTAGQQRGLLDEARRSGVGISLARAEKAAASPAGTRRRSRPAASLAADRPTPTAASAAAAAAGAAPASPAPEGGAEARATAPPAERPEGPWITVELTVRQLEGLLILLGREPADSPRAMVAQLLACL
jgi:ParB family chromosome partitioning protein